MQASWIEHLDVLGAALRFRASRVVTPFASDGDQDLLFATILSPFTMGLAPFTTTPGDYLSNTYWAVSPFDSPVGGRVKFRLVPNAASPPAHAGHGGREERLLLAVAEHRSALRLEVRHTFARAWLPLVTVALVERAALDQEALRFSPFRAGRGIVPRGLVHALRRPAYAASQRARPMGSS